MVEVVFADFRRAGDVEVHRGDVRRVVRNEEVGIGRGHQADEYRRRNAEADADRQQHFRGRRLAVNQHRDAKEGEGEGPRRVFDHFLNAALDVRHGEGEVGVAHPGDAEDGDGRDHAGFEDDAVRHGLHVGAGGKQDDAAETKHEHLDDDAHVDRFFHAGDGADGRQHGNDNDADQREDEEQHGVARGGRQFFVQSGAGGAQDAVAPDRVLHAALVFRVVFQFLAAAQAVERECEGSGEGSRNGDGDDIQQRDVSKRFNVRDVFQIKGDDGGNRAAGNGELRGN